MVSLEKYYAELTAWSILNYIIIVAFITFYMSFEGKLSRF